MTTEEKTQEARQLAIEIRDEFMTLAYFNEEEMTGWRGDHEDDEWLQNWAEGIGDKAHRIIGLLYRPAPEPHA